MQQLPYFTIVTPAYNRERQIRHAIDSCLEQDFSRFELIIVDDGSTDDTAAVVAAYSDPRIRLIRHSQNQGAGAARNTAIRAAAGTWIIYLDSDDELLPGCLSTVFDAVSTDVDQVGRFGFLYRIDKGGTSPTPPPPEGILGYRDWLRFIDQARWSDALWVTRRETFAHCTMPAGFGPEFLYNLDFSRKFSWKIIHEHVALVHTNSPDRLSRFRDRSDAEKELRRETDRLKHWNSVLSEHGLSLRQFAPRQYEGAIRSRAISLLLLGQRFRALQVSLGCVWRWPGSFVNWAVLLAILAGKSATRWGRAMRARSFAPVKDEMALPCVPRSSAGETPECASEEQTACGI